MENKKNQTTQMSYLNQLSDLKNDEKQDSLAEEIQNLQIGNLSILTSLYLSLRNLQHMAESSALDTTELEQSIEWASLATESLTHYIFDLPRTLTKKLNTKLNDGNDEKPSVAEIARKFIDE